MRLIDAEKLFEDLFVNNGKLCPDKDVDNFPITINVKDVKKAISKQPTACDVDAVVSELGKAYSKAVDDMVNTLIRNSRTEEIDGNICLIVTDKRIKLIAEQLKEGAGE